MERLSAAAAGLSLSNIASARQRVAPALVQFVWQVRRQLGVLTRQFGLWGWGLALLAVMVVVAVAVIYVQTQQAQALRARLNDALGTQEAGNAASSTAALTYADGRAGLKAFENHLLPHEEIPRVVQDVLRLAEKEGLSIQRGQYRPQIDTAGGFLRYRMSLPVQGPAPAIHRFIQSALRTQKTLALDSIQFKRERIQSSNVEVRIQWVVMARLPSATSANAVPANTRSAP